MSKSLRWWMSAVGLAAFLGLAIRQGGFPGEATEPEPELTQATPTTMIGSAPPVRAIQGAAAARDQAITPKTVNPTPQLVRPVAQPVTAVQPVQRSRVVLLGTTITDDGNFAHVRDVAGAPSKVLRKGDRVDGLLVTEIRPDRLLLSDGVTGREIIVEVGDETRGGAYSATTAADAALPLAASPPSVMSATPPVAPEYTEPAPSEEEQPASSAH